MPKGKWLNHYQPTTLQSAVILLYLNAAFALLTVLLYGVLLLASSIVLLTVAGIAAGYGIANEQKWGYWLGLVVAVVPAALDLLIFLHVLASTSWRHVSILTTLFEIVLVVLLVHPLSRGYARTWFK